ncbi:ferritin [Nocardioides currus]|uniref:Ferritin n=1 Tax=Nocardioides currus TaxID=2133958 RepID=A0A2R7Z359_9ACTN|nr:ferritin [Nocardioides currus]PUA82994.1 ferritin [Nocardioides currus]
MKLSSKLEKAFNAQITLEFQASLVYRQLAIELEMMDLPGMAAWLRHQADEEIVHANKFIDHVADRDNHPVIGATTAPQVKVRSVLDAFKAALAHEERVSESIRNLYRIAESEGDLDSRPLLNWFIEEQVEEEATVKEIVGRVTMIKDDGPGLLRLDEELGARPVATTEARTKG